MARRHRSAGVLVLATLAIGVLLSLALALAASMLRPTDGWPNILGHAADQWPERYFMPQFRFPVAKGDIMVDCFGSPLSTQVSLSPTWTRLESPQWRELLTVYAYPEDTSPQIRALYNNHPSFDVPSWATPCPDSATESQVITSAWGWPCRCLAGTERVYITQDPSDPSIALSVRHEFTDYIIRKGSPAAMSIRRIPLRPIWRGLALNSLLFAAVAAPVLLVPRLVRRTVRRRRGLCSACGYDLVSTPADAPCPECGVPKTGAVRA